MPPVKSKATKAAPPTKSLESWIWDAACSKVFLVNASQIFEKVDSKNFIRGDGIQGIAGVLISRTEEDKLSRIVDHAELKKNDYNISPSRYIHTSDAETFVPTKHAA